MTGSVKIEKNGLLSFYSTCALSIKIRSQLRSSKRLEYGSRTLSDLFQTQ